jgi:hypothetical protein
MLTAKRSTREETSGLSFSLRGERFIINFSVDYPFFPIHVMKSIMYVAIDGEPDEWKSIILLPFRSSKYVRMSGYDSGRR